MDWQNFLHTAIQDLGLLIPISPSQTYSIYVSFSTVYVFKSFTDQFKFNVILMCPTPSTCGVYMPSDLEMKPHDNCSAVGLNNTTENIM